MPALKTIFLFVFSFITILCQSQVSIPAYTGYATPTENETEESESSLFSEKEGLHNWTNTQQRLHYYFNLATTGPLTISLFVKNNTAGSKLQVGINDKKFIVTIPSGNGFKKIIAGTVQVNAIGFNSISLTALHKAGKTIADIQSIELSGKASKALQFNAKPRRNAASVHLRYPISDTSRIVSFYNEITVPAGADPLYTYYMACGFARGYFGIQVNSPTERRVIFSVWDAGNEAIDRNKVPDERKVKLLGKGLDVVTNDFGNEGTGGHSHFVYNWKAGEKYKFLVTALPDSATKTTIYTGYFFMPDVQKWKLIASFKAPEDAKYLNHLYSFVENFDGANGQLKRKAIFSNQWVREESGKWIELTNTSFSYDATGKAGDRTDYGAGVEDNAFYLWNGGFEKANVKYADTFSRKPLMQAPAINFYNNTDSLMQAMADKKIIIDAVAAGKVDTTASKEGIYYKMVKEGTGRNVLVSDTVTVFYKGYILNGETFDETKDKPATFPLNRLIKGWQLGLPFCKVGGKIQLIIPSGMGYSIRSRSPKIPPNSILVFDIEVMQAKEAVSN